MKTVEFMARNYIRYFSYHGPDYEYQEIKLDAQINKFLESEPTYKLETISPMGGDLNKVEGAKYLVTFSLIKSKDK